MHSLFALILADNFPFVNINLSFFDKYFAFSPEKGKKIPKVILGDFGFILF